MSERWSSEQQKERVRQRVRAQVDPNSYEYYPETVSTDHYNDSIYQRVAVYARVSTDNVRQTTSFELQKKYYEEFVSRHPKWELVGIYADEGISGTSTAHRDSFNQMISDARAGKIDLIITKSVSRFARNVGDFISTVRTLAEHHPRIGVFFESENIYSLKEDSQMALSFQAAMAEEESRNKSRSMETSLRMRLDHGLPLTPKLLGFQHNEDGKLIRDPDSYRIPKLMFYMCLFGYSTSQIAEKLTLLGKRSYKGNSKWTSNAVVSTLRNERYCGDVFTRKTFTPNVISHRSIKNRGERPRSRYLDEHESIVSRDDYIAVQHILNNSRYGNKSILPELRVIPDGLLKGFVIINPRWSGFKAQDYLRASASAYNHDSFPELPSTFEVDAGDFDLRGFEIAHLGLFDTKKTPSVSLEDGGIKFSIECLRRISNGDYVELLIHPRERKLAVRQTDKTNRNAVIWSKVEEGQRVPRKIACAAFIDTLFELFGWNFEYRYRLYGSLFRNEKENAYIFNAYDASVYIKEQDIEIRTGVQVHDTTISRSGKHIGVVSEELSRSFGKDFYLEKSLADLTHLSKEEWQIRIEGQLCRTGKQLQVTPYEELKSFIQEELGELFWEEETNADNRLS